MKRRNFLKSTATIAAVTASGTAIASVSQSNNDKEFYEFRVYQLTGGASKTIMKNYFTAALMPLFAKHGAKLGAFEEYDKEDPPKLYTLFTYPSFKKYLEISEELNSNQEYLNAAKSYSELPAAKPVYERYETYLMEAFKSIPVLKTPGKNRQILELRTYESYNEDAAKRKIAMFDDEELPLFEKVGLNPVFFGKIMAGKFMPALMYMLWFNDMEERERNWKTFVDSPEWKTMAAKPIYADTVSKVRKKFLTPTDYSQI